MLNDKQKQLVQFQLILMSKGEFCVFGLNCFWLSRPMNYLYTLKSDIYETFFMDTLFLIFTNTCFWMILSCLSLPMNYLYTCQILHIYETFFMDTLFLIFTNTCFWMILFLAVSTVNYLYTCQILHIYMKLSSWNTLVFFFSIFFGKHIDILMVGV